MGRFPHLHGECNPVADAFRVRRSNRSGTDAPERTIKNNPWIRLGRRNWLAELVHRCRSVNADPAISLVMPARDAESTIAEAIRSIQNQSFSDWELIVVDDQSTDRTREIADKFGASDPRIRTVQTEPPSARSVSAARNRGMAVARGRYITFPDADDVAVPIRLHSTITAMMDTEATIGFADFQRFSDQGDFLQPHLAGNHFMDRAALFLEPFGHRRYIARSEFVGFMLTDMISLSVQTTMVDRSLIGADRFDESMIGGEDLDLFYRIAVKNEARIVYLDDVLTRMRTHGASVTSTRRRECEAGACLARFRALSALASCMTPAQRIAAKRAVSAAYFSLGYGLRTDGDARAARAAYVKSFSIHPSSVAAFAYGKSFIAPRPVEPQGV